MPVAAPPIAMLTLPPAFVHTTAPLTFWFLPSMVTVGAAAPLPGVATLNDVPLTLPLVLDLLLEHPEIPATRIAAPATATVSSRFTCSPLPDGCGPSRSRTVSAVCGFAGPHRIGSAKLFRFG